MEVNQVKILTFPFLNAVFPWYSIRSVLGFEDCIPGAFFFFSFSKHKVCLIFLLLEMINRMGLVTSKLHFKMYLACYFTGKNSQWKRTGVRTECNHNWMGNPLGWKLDPVSYFPFLKADVAQMFFPSWKCRAHRRQDLWYKTINSKTSQPDVTSAKPLGHCRYTNSQLFWKGRCNHNPEQSRQ